VSSITAQLSVYPLGAASLSPTIDKALRILRERGLDVEAGTMSSLVSGDDDVVFAAVQSAFHQIAAMGPVVMVATFSNACPTAKTAEEVIAYNAIGHVENAFDELAAPDQIKAAESRIVLDPALVEGLQGLEAGQRLMVVFCFHRSQRYDLRQHPRGDRTREPRGVFALHSPHRPNPIGVTTVDLVKLAGNVLYVRGLDAINGTPVLDLKRQS
jgi:tRNA-Thr(GGU) m(6)t(6)A37 methyltransferase TsaA